ncbi:hypothetical protein H696_03094 [Fonticula alba]|uniref:Adenylate kinase isoenzyme 6 homolog n=1 Tax=Fonticula alba TaxID=691883 RepID=A0A058Z9Y2_FONAL|nr:hypothetical protein H696_03094 [Fonticula alba]KCV70743.1 hypothetical protein H696_03094 [Fonticula alba]|eukprot:XP_009495259.1 hypothetical protein H696_03094 [Fonticula alba]
MPPTSRATRTKPNILITGTPGTGKTTLAGLVTSALPDYQLLEVGKVVAQRNLHCGRDESFDTLILDEDLLLDEMELILGGDDAGGRGVEPQHAARGGSGGWVVDYHSSDLFPERWFDMVIVLRSSTSILNDRLVMRSYSEKKISENIMCEIMDVSFNEALEAYHPSRVLSLPSDSIEEMSDNVSRVVEWAEAWEQSMSTHGVEARIHVDIDPIGGDGDGSGAMD